MTTMAVADFLERMLNDPECIISDAPQRFSEAASDGDFFRQGDVYVWRRDRLPSGIIPDPKPLAQLAEGETKGSRHILDSLEGVTMYRRVQADALQGPIFELTMERVIRHPEHGHVICPVGIYEITYQRAMAAELKRVRD